MACPKSKPPPPGPFRKGRRGWWSWILKPEMVSGRRIEGSLWRVAYQAGPIKPVCACVRPHALRVYRKALQQEVPGRANHPAATRNRLASNQSACQLIPECLRVLPSRHVEPTTDRRQANSIQIRPFLRDNVVAKVIVDEQNVVPDKLTHPKHAEGLGAPRRRDNCGSEMREGLCRRLARQVFRFGEDLRHGDSQLFAQPIQHLEARTSPSGLEEVDVRLAETYTTTELGLGQRVLESVVTQGKAQKGQR